jgi:serine/threonine protein kinase
MAELYLRRPIYQGHSDIDQLCKIFEIMGIPAEHEWPAQSAIPRQSFINKNILKQPKIGEIITNMDQDGMDLLLRLLDYSLLTRITAREALLHNYFKSGLASNEVQILPDVTNVSQHSQPNILKRRRNNQNHQKEKNTENVDPQEHNACAMQTD